MSLLIVNSFGECSYFRGNKKAIVTSDLEFVKEVMVRKFANFIDREVSPSDL